MLKKYQKFTLYFSLFFLVIFGVGCADKNKVNTKKDSDIIYYQVEEENIEKESGSYFWYSKYNFAIYFPYSFVEETNMSFTTLREYAFPQDMLDNSNLIYSSIHINRNVDTCEELGFGNNITPGWQFAEKTNLNELFKSKIFIGEVEFNRQFCGGILEEDKIVESLVYTTYKDNEPISFSLILISSPIELFEKEKVKPFNPEIFEIKYLDILKTFKYKD